MSKNFQETYHGKKIDTANILNIEDASKLINARKTVVITGVTGQDGSHMVDFLLKNTDYLIFGGVRRLSVYNHENIRHINSDRFHLINFDLTDPHAIARTVEKIQPDYFINFAAQSFVASSWDFARQTWAANSTSILDILEAIRLYKPSCRLYQAGSSEEFGNILYAPQDEKHPLRPRSPYGASKAASRQLIKVYRDSYNLYAIQGWLFNHEGTRRGEEFVTRKVTKNVARIFNSIKNNQEFVPLELISCLTFRAAFY
jgi:GDPmannose 4,6-dehydratase